MNEVSPQKSSSSCRRDPTKEEMNAVFALCRSNHWSSCLQCLKNNPAIGTTTMIMDNHITTTVCHQAITSKGDVQQRAACILQILSTTPEAAKIRNGYGSTCLHVISQRNTKIDSKTKEKLIIALIRAYPGALMEAGGVGKRTPLHIIFTDYVSPRLTQLMIEKGKQATFMKDKNAWLPIHVACSRHVSPEKLRFLIDANPDSIYATTSSGDTVLGLAQSTATRTHPNFRLIESLKEALQNSSDGYGGRAAALDAASIVPARVSSNDTADSEGSNTTPATKKTRKRKPAAQGKRAATRRVKTEPMDSTPAAAATAVNMETPDAADLLLQFARGSGGNGAENHPTPTKFEVPSHTLLQCARGSGGNGTENHPTPTKFEVPSHTQFAEV